MLTGIIQSEEGSMKKPRKCQWCGLGFGNEAPVYDETTPASFRMLNPLHAPCLVLRRARAASPGRRRLMRRINAALRDET